MPRFEDQAVGLKLAFIGSIKDEILQTEELAAELVTFMNKNYPGVLESKYNVEEDADPYGMIARIAESRHCLVRGNELDTEKASVLLMDDFRNGRLGRLTLNIRMHIRKDTHEYVQTFKERGRRKRHPGGTRRMACVYTAYHRSDLSDHHLCRTADDGKRLFHGDDITGWRQSDR